MEACVYFFIVLLGSFFVVVWVGLLFGMMNVLWGFLICGRRSLGVWCLLDSCG